MRTSLLWANLLLLATSNVIAESDGKTEDQEVSEFKEKSGGIWELGFVIGGADLYINEAFSVSQQKETLESMSSGIELFYHWENNFRIESSYVSTVDLDIFNISDDYKLQQFEVLLGYRYQFSDNLSITPKIGFSSWDLDTEEGQFLNPGPEDTFAFDGTDLTYEIDFEIPLTTELSFTLSYEKTEFEFGGVEITNLGMTFEL